MAMTDNQIIGVTIVFGLTLLFVLALYVFVAIIPNRGCSKGFLKIHDWRYRCDWKPIDVEWIKNLSINLTGKTTYRVNERYECTKCHRTKNL